MCRSYISFVLIVLSGLSFGAGAQEIDEYLLWAKSPVFGERAQPAVNQSDLDANRNLYVIGTYFKEYPWDIDPSQTVWMQQIFVRKYDKDGNQLWSKEFGNGLYYSTAGDIRVDREGNIVFSGYFYDPDGTAIGQPMPGFFLCKADPDGNILWVTPLSRTYLPTWGERLGMYSKQSHMEIDKDNSIVLLTNGNPPLTATQPADGLYISRYSTTGAVMNQFQLTRDDNFDTPLIGGLAIDDGGNFIFTGTYQVSLKIGPVIFGTPGPQGTVARMFIAKFSANGEFIWAKQAAEIFGAGMDVVTDESGNIYWTGFASGYATLGSGIPVNETGSPNGFLAKLTPNGDVVWSRTMTGMPISIVRTSPGDLYISGTSQTFTFGNHKQKRVNEQAFVMMYKSDETFGGAIVSEGLPSGLTSKFAYNSSVDSDGSVYTIGNYNSLIAFGCDTLRSQGEESAAMFITKYSSIPPNYSLEISGPADQCEGVPFVLSVSPVPEPVKYEWQLPAGAVFDEPPHSNQIEVTLPLSAQHAEINVTIRKGCYTYWNAESFLTNVLGNPGPTQLSGQSVFCQPGATRLYTGVSTHATAYQWNLPAGVVPVLGSLRTLAAYIDVVISDQFRNGTVSVKGENSCRQGVESPPFYIQLIPPLPTATFVNRASEFCNHGQMALFEVEAIPDATSYVWAVPPNFEPSGIVVTSLPKIQARLMNAGKAEITIYSRNECGSSAPTSKSLEIEDPLPIPSLYKDSACDLSLSTEDAESLAWFRDGNRLEVDGTTLLVPGPGTYHVTVSNGCGPVSSQSIDMSPVSTERIVIPNVITPNNDGKNDRFSIQGGLDGMGLQILNRWGKVVYQSSDYRNDWDAAELSAGVYYYVVEHSCFQNQFRGWVQVLREE